MGALMFVIELLCRIFHGSPDSGLQVYGAARFCSVSKVPMYLDLGSFWFPTDARNHDIR